ncbi:hypothetical protein [Streptomyces sp. Go-475]|uniref:hypothetical protein n=1 Tax=Streptomyces sp. Go-475 TaxID=2072505 RepID=UPI0013005BDA|nr:hypothetical protein [Streptomyces sp. Go-475]
MRLRLPPEETGAAGAAHPRGERLVRAGAPAGVAVPLADVDGQGPQRAGAGGPVQPGAEAARRVPGRGRGGGRPPRRGPAVRDRQARPQALCGAGLATLEQVARHSRAELLAPHGVGPQAVRVPAGAPERRGLALRV